LFLLTGHVYLVGGEHPKEGNLYAFNPKTEKLGPVCDDGNDSNDAQSLLMVSAYSFTPSPATRGRCKTLVISKIKVKTQIKSLQI